MGESTYALDRLMAGNLRSRTTLPLRGSRKSPIPLVSGLKITRLDFFSGTMRVFLTWTDPERYRDVIDRFQVYVSFVGTTPTVVAEARNSPAIFDLARTGNKQTVNFRVQTILKNGEVSDFDFSPTATSLLD
jgi:hypothetical protein